jgi:hypothetical protein
MIAPPKEDLGDGLKILIDVPLEKASFCTNHGTRKLIYEHHLQNFSI